MGLIIDNKVVGGLVIDNKVVGGFVVDNKLAYRSDQPGTMSLSVTQSGRNYEFQFSVTDADGIRSLTSATARASDGTTDDVLADLSRSDADTFSGTDSRRNARWASGTMTVQYVDATSGETRTVSERWSV